MESDRPLPLTPLAPEPTSYRARYVFPVASPPIADGLVTTAHGRIVAVGPHQPGVKALDLGNVAILPGLVNAHTHLEFSLLEKPLGDPSDGFCAWIGEVIRHRQERTYSDAEGIAAGRWESHRAGVALVGEIASQSWPQFAPGAAEEAPPMAGVVFRELLGLSEARGDAQLEIAREHVTRKPSEDLLNGLSPHAPYTVSPRTVERAVELAASGKAPVAMHLAETMEELELLASHSGRMRELLDRLGAWSASAIPRGIRPLDYLRLLSQAPRALVIHGNYLTSGEIRWLGERSPAMSVVYCPRTHAFFGHQQYPLQEMLRAGVNVALGTDSRASNPDLHLWSEARFVATTHPETSPAEILRMATVSGAVALGLNHAWGTIEPGKRAALCMLPLPAGDVASDDPHEMLFS